MFVPSPKFLQTAVPPCRRGGGERGAGRARKGRPRSKPYATNGSAQSMADTEVAALQAKLDQERLALAGAAAEAGAIVT